jgi:hypothetical protein
LCGIDRQLRTFVPATASGSGHCRLSATITGDGGFDYGALAASNAAALGLGVGGVPGARLRRTRRRHAPPRAKRRRDGVTLKTVAAPAEAPID